LRFLWRISNHRDLEGRSAKIYTARWHTAGEGKRVVYLEEHPAVALIEVLVNVQGDQTELSRDYQLIKVAVPDDVCLDRVPEASLSKNWREKPAETQLLGNAWLSECRSALLAVPSASSPESTNYLLNPLHGDARKLSIEWARRIEYDKRLFRTLPYSM
jgi:RES domain-containing protein